MTLPTLAAAAAALEQPLSEAQLAQMEQLRALLLEWNQRLNLTAIRDPDAFEVLHLIDSIAGLAALPPEPGLKVIDVGTGGGMPGLALKVARPDIELTLLDSVGKKLLALEAVVEELGLTGVEAMHARAEDVGRHPVTRETWDVALARAVGTVVVLAELCLPLVKVGGLVVAWKKRDVADEITVAGRGVSILGGRRLKAMPVDLPGLPPDRQLVMLAKERPTPPRYPRLPGVPERQPLVGETR